MSELRLRHSTARPVRIRGAGPDRKSETVLEPPFTVNGSAPSLQASSDGKVGESIGVFRLSYFFFEPVGVVAAARLFVGKVNRRGRGIQVSTIWSVSGA
jgi:hypothetical protein